MPFNISPYLVEGPNTVLLPRTLPPQGIPKMSWGNKPSDGGHLIVEASEIATIQGDSIALSFLRPYISAASLIDGSPRFCFWLKDASPNQIQQSPILRDRVKKVAEFRLDSKAQTTRDYAAFPGLFRQISQPETPYLALPETSSELRRYIPMAYVTPDVICSNSIQFIPSASTWHFGILNSAMHMSWVKLVAGRLKSDFRYSNTLVYNNYPWPQNPTDAQRLNVERCAQAVLDTRAEFTDSTLATLYDPALMPPSLVRAHQQLDKAVERCYRPESFPNDRIRVEYLLTLYEQLAAPLLPTAPSRRRLKS